MCSTTRPKSRPPKRKIAARSVAIGGGRNGSMPRLRPLIGILLSRSLRFCMQPRMACCKARRGSWWAKTRSFSVLPPSFPESQIQALNFGQSQIWFPRGFSFKLAFLDLSLCSAGSAAMAAVADGDVEDQKSWVTIYPSYINSALKITQGRKIAKADACELHHMRFGPVDAGCVHWPASYGRQHQTRGDGRLFTSAFSCL